MDTQISETSYTSGLKKEVHQNNTKTRVASKLLELAFATSKQLNFNGQINSVKLIKVIKMLQKIYFKACCEWKIQHPTPFSVFTASKVKAKVILSFSSLH